MGKMAEIKDDLIGLELYMKMIEDFYLKYTKMPKKKLQEILKHDIWWSAEQALEYGLVDEIL